MMGQIGTPIIAVESGYVEALGWNQYGGWRIGLYASAAGSVMGRTLLHSLESPTFSTSQRFL